MKLYAICNIWSSIYGYLTIVSKQNTWLIQYWYSMFNWKTGISTRMELSTLHCVSFINPCVIFCVIFTSGIRIKSVYWKKILIFPFLFFWQWCWRCYLAGHPLKVFSLNTGRFNLETYQFFDTVKKHYGSRIECMFPDAIEAEGLVSVAVRKVRPHLLAHKI